MFSHLAAHSEINSIGKHTVLSHSDEKKFLYIFSSLVGFSHVLKNFRFTFYILYDPDNLKRRMVANGNDFQISLRS